MLCLARREGESIVVGDNVTITVTRIENGQVRIGIEAPPAVRIMRTELLDREPVRLAATA